MACSRLTRFAVVLGVGTLLHASPGFAAGWMWDQNSNEIDDRIEQVEAQGLAAAHVGNLLTGKLRFAVLNTAAPFLYGVYVRYDHHPTDADAAALAALGLLVQVRYRSIHYIRTRLTATQAAQVAAQPGVDRIETIPLMYAVNDVATQVIRARESNGQLHPATWRHLGATGRGVSVAILDSGVNDDVFGTYPGHESLRGKFLGGGNFFAGQPDLNTPIDQSENPRHTLDPEGVYHGTHVAGTAIGSGGPNGILNGAEPGFEAGLAPDARLVDCKVLSDGGVGFGSADALDWLVYHRFDSWGLTGADSIYRGVDVANMSVGSLDESDGTDAACAAVNAAVNAGIVVCIATGNDGNTGYIASPGAADLGIAVGAFADNNTVNRGDDVVASYSNEGPRDSDGDGDSRDEMKPNILGSGTGITSALGDPTTNGDEYHHINGTSMATPCVAGVAALILSAHPQLFPMQVRRIIEDTADHRTDNGKQPPSASDPFGVDPNYHPSWGWGQIDAYAAVKEALNPATTQVVRIAATPQRGPDGVKVDWWTQREIGLAQFGVERAPDVLGGPGAWTAVTTVPVASPSAEIHGVANRHAYSYTDTDPSLVPSARYWYRVTWTEDDGRVHIETPLRVRIEDSPTIARVQFSWTHDYSDGDLAVKYGTGTDTDHPVWVRFAPGAPSADSIVTRSGSPPLGTLQHYFHFDLTADDGIDTFLPPSGGNPWFLSVKEGGFLDTHGRVNDFSVTVFGPSGQTTYTAPNPVTENVEGQETVFWIPLDPELSVNHAPVLSPVASPTTIGEGLLLGITLSATDADGDALTYSASGLPAGATFTPGTRRFEWTPDFDDAGSYSVRFRVADGAGLFAASDSQDVAITVTARNPGDNQPPLLDPLHDRDAFVGERLSLNVHGRDPEGAALAYSSPNLPAGATLDPVTGAFGWTPAGTQQGPHVLTFTASDGSLSTQTTMFVRVTHPGYGPQPPPPPQPCDVTSTHHTGVVGPGIQVGDQDVQLISFTVPPNTQRIEGSLLWFGGPAVDLDLYLLDPDSVEVASAASVSDPEVLMYNAPRAGHYTWKIVSFNNPDTAEFSLDQDLCVANQVSGVGDVQTREVTMSAAMPNPFRTLNTLRFTMPRAGIARLSVFDVVGRRVRTLQDGWVVAGTHVRVWDRRTDYGTRAAAGVYFYRLEAGGKVLGQKVIAVR